MGGSGNYGVVDKLRVEYSPSPLAAGGNVSPEIICINLIRRIHSSGFKFLRHLQIILVGVIIGASCQGPHYPSSHRAAILSDARYLAGDGTFGAAYSQEDGVEFKEESDVEGNRRGSYSYVDPNGQRHTVTYTAGKNGFQATGDHIPSAPPPVPPQPEYVPLSQYNPPDYQPPSYAPPPPQQYARRYQSDYEQQPVVYQPRFQPQYQYRPLPQPQPQPQLQPQPQVQPHYHHPPELQSIPSYAPSRSYYQPQPQPRPAPQYNAITTPAPRNFYPPGKLDFNRTPDGFSYMFIKS
ncbi:pupal cuticle protein [Ooceraea biroi]|uniref:pupal cuticle protein n=1 Tax=Ooceraea biroi TaxID=2015173 RepID=UPI000F07C57F|nr:pupal cuticle protein [Ooceraea biroi]